MNDSLLNEYYLIIQKRLNSEDLIYLSNNKKNINNKRKTIYMTYYKDIPKFVFERWLKININYIIKFSKDNQCSNYINEYYGKDVRKKFNRIKKGKHKADLWRLCKLFENGGSYADVDLVPYLKIDDLDKNINFYSVLDVDKKGIFQAFIVNLKKKSNLILVFLMSLLINEPYNIENGPTIDMYKIIKYNLEARPKAHKIYNLEKIKLKIKIKKSNKNIKLKNLYYFPKYIKYEITLKDNNLSQYINITIKDTYLIIESKKKFNDKISWPDLEVWILFPEKNKIYLFEEYEKKPKSHSKYIENICVLDKNKNKILDSRDPEYVKNNGW